MYRASIRVLLAASLLILAACGGGTAGDYGLGTPGGGGGTVAVEGTWSGSYTIGAGGTPVPIFAAIAQDGYAFFYDSLGTVYVLPKLTGSSTLTGDLTAYAAQGTTFASGMTVETFAVTATVSNSSITGTFTGNSETGTFTLSPTTPFAGNPSIVGGNWHGFYVTDPSTSTTAVALTVQPGGVLVGNDADGCSLSGNLTQVASEDLFTVTVDSSGGASCGGSLTGLAYESDTDDDGLFGGATGTYYYLGVSNATTAFTAELKVQ